MGLLLLHQYVIQLQLQLQSTTEFLLLHYQYHRAMVLHLLQYRRAMEPRYHRTMEPH